MINLPKPKAVLFDWDGTIVHSLDAIIACYNLVQDHFGEPHYSHDEIYAAMAKGSSRDSFNHFYPGQTDKIEEAIRVYYQNGAALRAKHFAVVDGAEQVFKRLHAVGVPVGIVSNARQFILDDEIKRLGWTPYFAAVIGANDGLLAKPDPDPIYRAFDAMKLDRGILPETWFLGDTRADAGAARAAGCPFLYYTGALAAGRAPEQLGETVQFADYQQLLHRIDDLFVTA